MLADDMDRAVSIADAVTNRLPGRAVITGHENEDAEVVAAMAVECCVRGALVEARGDHAADVDPLLRRDVLPSLAAVARDLQIAVVRAGVEEIAIQGRLADRGDGGPGLNTVIARHGELVGHAA